jgi:nucleotide-binding universal stress UspA family protein
MTRIVVGVDASEGSRRALEWAVEEARLRHAQLEVVHVWHYPYLASGPWVPVPDPGEEAFEADARHTLEVSLEGVDTSALEPPVESTLGFGGAVPALIAAAKGADLLVVGSRGRGGFTGLLLGSVSQELTHHAPCPLVIVPHESD